MSGGLLISLTLPRCKGAIQRIQDNILLSCVDYHRFYATEAGEEQWINF